MHVREDGQTASDTPRKASYRERVRAKLIERGCPPEELEARAEELMHRKLPITVSQMVKNAR